jgi:hypothetical protein
MATGKDFAAMRLSGAPQPPAPQSPQQQSPQQQSPQQHQQSPKSARPSTPSSRFKMPFSLFGINTGTSAQSPSQPPSAVTTTTAPPSAVITQPRRPMTPSAIVTTAPNMSALQRQPSSPLLSSASATHWSHHNLDRHMSISSLSSAMSYADVRETPSLVRQVDPVTGHKVINGYAIVRQLGRGVHGKVKLGLHLESGQLYVRHISYLPGRRSRLYRNGVESDSDDWRMVIRWPRFDAKLPL